MATARKKRWSQRVTETSDAMTLEKGVFTRGSARSIAASIKRSAERSHRRKSPPFRSAMSMLTFYENRAGKTLPASAKRKLEAAKEELRKLYGKPTEKKAKSRPHGSHSTSAKRRRTRTNASRSTPTRRRRKTATRPKSTATARSRSH